MTAILERIPVRLDIENAKHYVRALLTKKLSPDIYFHTFEHTRRVFKAVTKLSKKAHLTADEKEILQIAALFHDTGFIKSYENHEEHSIFIAVAYLRDKGYPERKIDLVKRIIEATRLDLAPATFLQKLMCDADTCHIGQKGYRRRSELLRKEWEFKRPNYFRWISKGKHQFSDCI